MIGFILKTLKKYGIQINKYPKGDLKRKIHFFNYYNINKVFDVGANKGQYAMSLRDFGYKGEIISFEPLSSAYSKLKENSNNDGNWEINNYAIGNQNKQASINISENLVSSSFNEMLDSHKNSAPSSLYIGKEIVEIKSLDAIYKNYFEEKDNIFLKVDTQGFEKNVIDGADEFLGKVVLLQLEMSILALYENEMLLSEMIEYLNLKNFQLIGLENGFSDPDSNHLLQVEGIFINRNFLKK